MAIVISLSFVRSGSTAHDSVERFIECNRRVDIFTTSLHHHAGVHFRLQPLQPRATSTPPRFSIFAVRPPGLGSPRPGHGFSCRTDTKLFAWACRRRRLRPPSLDSVMPPRAVDLTACEVVMSSTRIDVKRYNTAQNNSSRGREIDMFGRAYHFFHVLTVHGGCHDCRPRTAGLFWR